MNDPAKYEITDEDNVPAELSAAFADGRTIEVQTVIGWIAVDDPGFRFGCIYRVAPKQEQTNG